MSSDRLDHCEKLKQLIATCFFASLADVKKRVKRAEIRNEKRR
jgi:hypothetical protein